MEDLSFEQMVVIVEKEFDLTEQQARRLVASRFWKEDVPPDWVHVPVEVFGQWLNEQCMWLMPAAAGQSGKSPPPEAGNGNNKNRGGASESHMWTMIWAEIAILAAKRMISNNKEAFYRTLEGHLNEKGIRSPSTGYLGKKVTYLYERLIQEGLTQEQIAEQ